MAKQGMSRPNRTHVSPENDVSPVPEIQGKAKHTKKSANPIIMDGKNTPPKTFHTKTPVAKPSDADNSH